MFSSKNRQGIIEHMQQQVVDVLVIGGGVTGAGIALDAAARGLKVALVEMQDFASGTSGRSTKLIHGGLRYLKQMELRLVAEVGKEREIIHKIAPQLTHPETMLLPIVKNGSFNRFSIRLGMWAYEWLAGVKKQERHKILNARQTLAAEPLLKKNGLLAGVLYYEYRTDDARLTIELIKEAVKRGALVRNYTKVTGFLYDAGKIKGIRVKDRFNGNTYEVQASYIVNAAGPWVDELDELDKEGQGAKLNLTKGVHLVVDGKKLPVKQSLYIDTDDKRMIFIIPREGKTYIGTTDTFYQGDKVHPKISLEDKIYLLKSVNAYFPDTPINLNDIESGWAGLRPLINKPGKGPSEISRKDEMFQWDSGLITIAGGKLTGYRKMAQRVVDAIVKKINAARTPSGTQIRACSTNRISLAGGNPEDGNSFPQLLKQMQQEGGILMINPDETKKLVSRYGSNTAEIFRIYAELKNKKQGKLPLLIQAQLLYTIEHELCTTPADFFIRRTGAIYFDVQMVKQCKEEVMMEMKNLLGWGDEITQQMIREMDEALNY